MNNETSKIEQLIQAYMQDQGQSNLEALVSEIQKTQFYIPAMLPNTPEVEALRKSAKENKGQQVKIPDGVVPIPSIIRNSKGVVYIPIYTSVEQIPKEPKFDLIMDMPFRSCYTLALNQNVGAEGITINPFSSDLIMSREMLETIRNKDKALANGAGEIRLTPEQYKIMMRQKAEFKDFPLKAYTEGAEFINRLCDEKEAVVNEIYQNAYQQPRLYPYTEKDFSVMPLNIRQDLLLARIDLPAVKDNAQLCYRIYVTLNPDNNEVHYFTIERGKEKKERNLGGIDAEGKHIVYGEAPVEGAEIQRIMDIIAQEKEQTS